MSYYLNLRIKFLSDKLFHIKFIFLYKLYPIKFLHKYCIRIKILSDNFFYSSVNIYRIFSVRIIKKIYTCGDAMSLRWWVWIMLLTFSGTTVNVYSKFVRFCHFWGMDMMPFLSEVRISSCSSKAMYFFLKICLHHS